MRDRVRESSGNILEEFEAPSDLLARPNDKNWTVDQSAPPRFTDPPGLPPPRPSSTHLNCLETRSRRSWTLPRPLLGGRQRRPTRRGLDRGSRSFSIEFRDSLGGVKEGRGGGVREGQYVGGALCGSGFLKSHLRRTLKSTLVKR